MAEILALEESGPCSKPIRLPVDKTTKIAIEINWGGKVYAFDSAEAARKTGFVV